MENTTKEKKSLRQWWAAHKPTKRRIIQLYAALLTNANLKGFGSGYIYMGKSKYACVPGMNCYSCPGAVGACPLGALQNALNATNTKLPYYIFGILLLYGFLFGRWICGFLCPFGLIQDLLYKVKTPKVKKNRLTRSASYLKYILLIVFVVIIPLLYAGKLPLPGFCKYICPSGTLLGAGGLLTNEKNEGLLGMLGPLFTWKFLLLVGFIVGAIFIYRFFCRFFCPLGAIYGLFNKISFLGMKLDKSKCVDCGLCVGECRMDVKKVGDHECISCGRCVNVCPTNAISYKGPKILLAPNEIGGRPNTKPLNVDPCDAPGTPLPKKTKIARLIVGLSMLAVLAGTLYYFNFVHKDPKPIESQTIIGDDGKVITVGGELGNQCPDYDMPLYFEEGTINASHGRGKITVVNFWYIYCSACVHELQTEFPALQETYGDDVEIIVVHSYEEFGQDIPAWINKNLPTDAGFIHCRDVEGDTFFKNMGGTSAWPITVILDKEGIIQYKAIGSTTFKEMSAVIDGLLSDAPLPESPNNKPEAPSIGSEVGNVCPEYDITMYFEEGTINSNSSRGKATLINFWYCFDPIGTQMLQTVLPTLKGTYGDDLDIIAVHSYEEFGTDIPAWIGQNLPADTGIVYCRDVSGEGFFKAMGGKTTWPITILLDENGIITYKAVGSVTLEEIQEAINGTQ